MKLFLTRILSHKKILIGSAAAVFAVLVLILACPSLYANTGHTDSQHYMRIVNSIFDYIERNYVDEVDPEVLYEGAIKGMLEALEDPHTTYLDKKMMSDMNDTTTGCFGGVGLQISKPVVSTPEKPAYVDVVSPIEDTPGWKAGIHSGDKIIEIEGVSTIELTMDEVLAQLRGTVGETVNIIIRRGKNMEFPVALTRALIEVPVVKYGMMEDGIAYLRVIEFTRLTAKKVQEALDSFDKHNYRSLIIDLRNNPGGMLNSVVDVADKFIDSGVIVSTKSRIPDENNSFTARSGRTTVAQSVPIVVLINKGSASASEILAGALKDYHRGYLIGETSYGKGSVQKVMMLRDVDGMKFTTARYYTPSDANIDKTGIMPDRVVLFPEFTEEEETSLSELLQTTRIADYVEEHPDMTEADADVFAETLYTEFPVQKRFLRKLIILEMYRTKESPLYDLEYDVQLKEAVSILKNENVFDLLKTTLTVAEMKEAAGPEQIAAEK